MVKGGETKVLEFIKAGIETEKYIYNIYPDAKEPLEKIKRELQGIPFLNDRSYRKITRYFGELKERIGGDISPSDIFPLITYIFPEEELDDILEEEDDDDAIIHMVEGEKILLLYLILRYHPYRSIILKRLISREIKLDFFLRLPPGEMVKMIEFLTLADPNAVEIIKGTYSSDNVFFEEEGLELKEPKNKYILSYPYLTEFAPDRDIDSVLSSLRKKILLTPQREKLAKLIFFRLNAFEDIDKAIVLIGPRGIGKSTLVSSLLTALEWPFFSISLSPGVLDELLGSREDAGLILKGVISCGVINPCMVFDDIETSNHKVEKFLFQIVDPYLRQEMKDRYTGTRLLLGKAPLFLVGNKLNKCLNHPAFAKMIDVYEVPPLELTDMIIILSEYILPKVISRMKPSYRKILEPLRDREIVEFIVDTVRKKQAIEGGYTLSGLENAIERFILILLSKKLKKITPKTIKGMGSVIIRELGGEIR